MPIPAPTSIVRATEQPSGGLTRESPRAEYKALYDRYSEEQRALAVRSRQIAWARLVTFIAGALIIIWAIQGGGSAAWILTVLALVLFGVLVFFHDRFRRADEYAAGRRDLAALGLARLDRDWKRLPVWEAPPDIARHPYASDLDLFGRGALTQLLGAPGSPHGRARVYQWLLDLPPAEETAARQLAVHELTQRHAYREHPAVSWQPGHDKTSLGARRAGSSPAIAE